MQARPYRLLGQSLLAAVRNAFDGALDAWCADWGVARSEMGIECRRAWEAREERLPASAWRHQVRQGDAAAWLAEPAELAQALQRALFAPERHYVQPRAEAPLAAETAEAALRALCDGLLSTALPGGASASVGEAPPAALYDHASGALSVSVSVGRQACVCVLNPAAVQVLAEQARLRGRLPVEPVAALNQLDYRAVLASVPVTLPIEIGRVQLGLGSLMSLGLGDVIRLDSAADHPLPVHGPSGAVLFDAYLGLADQHVALEVVRHKPQ